MYKCYLIKDFLEYIVKIKSLRYFVVDKVLKKKKMSSQDLSLTGWGNLMKYINYSREI